MGQSETITTTEGAEQKIRCSNGSLVDSGSECSSTDECPFEPSENVTFQGIQSSQQINRNNNTNATNASSLVDADGTENEEEDDQMICWSGTINILKPILESVKVCNLCI